MFLFSRSTSAVTLLSRTPAGVSTAGNGESLVTSLSADGTVVSFGSYVTDLVAGQNDANNGTDLFGWKSGSGVTLGSHIPGSTTTAANHRSAGGRISANGAYVAFPSKASDLVAGQVDPSSDDDMFLLERSTGRVTLVSHSSAGPLHAVGEWFNMSYDINADGSQVVFTTEDPAVVAGQVDSSTADDGFLFERATGTVTLVSRTATSAKTTGDGYLTDAGVLANDGTVAFLSNSTNLVNGQVDTNTRIDLFLYKAPYKVFLGDAKVVEGENGSRTVNLPVTLSEPSSAPVNFTYATANLSATQPADYKSKTGTLSIPAGTAGTSLAITVYGDTSVEGNEAFKVTLSAAAGATIADATGAATIVDDDASSGVRLAVGDVTLYEGGQRQPDGTADRQPVEAGYLDGDRGLHNRQRQRHRRG